MPAKSDKQATAARIALQVKKGKKKAKPGSASAEMAKSMTKKQLKDYTKKESIKILDDVVVETSKGIEIIPAGSVVMEVAVTTGNVAFVPGCDAGEKKRSKGKGKGLSKGKGKGPNGIPAGLEDEDDELDENSNSQVSPLQLDH